MNERIKLLAEQARLHAKTVDADLNPQGWMDEYHQKFAELIVNKCANIVWDEAEKTSNSDVNDAGYKIIEHFFGVEE